MCFTRLYLDAFEVFKQMYFEDRCSLDPIYMKNTRTMCCVYCKLSTITEHFQNSGGKFL